MEKRGLSAPGVAEFQEKTEGSGAADTLKQAARWIQKYASLLLVVGLIVSVAAFLESRFNDIRAEVREVRGALNELRQEVDGDVRELRNEFGADIDALELTLRADVYSLRSEIQSSRTEVLAEIRALREQ